MTSLMILESKPLDHIKDVLARDYVDVVVTNWSLWMPAMLFNFRFVKGPWQVLFSNGVGFVWNVYLSWKTQEGGGDPSGGQELGNEGDIYSEQ